MKHILEIFKEFPFIEMEKYYLRKIKLSDYKEIYNIYSCEETLRFEGMSTLKNEEQAKEYIDSFLKGYENKHFIRWGISSKESDKLIGLVALHHIDYRNLNAQIGYILNKDYWNKKIMSEVLRTVIKFLFDNTELHRLEVNINKENKASFRLAEKVGFVTEGLKIECAYNKTMNKYEDRIVMSLLNK
jgi:ribosomal-protein-alanine N-acetyltransferase